MVPRKCGGRLSADSASPSRPPSSTASTEDEALSGGRNGNLAGTPLTNPLLITQPGEGIQLDVKYVYPHGRREYQFTVIDPFTEKCYAEIFPTRESKNAALAIERASKYFGFPILSVQTDNGSEFRGGFHGWCETNHIPHFFIPKKSPYWNGKVERVHRTVDEEFYQNPFRIWRTLQEWLTYYNTERLHETLGGITPQEKVDQVIHTVTP